jgi:hypothetical protein
MAEGLYLIDTVDVGCLSRCDFCFGHVESVALETKYKCEGG